ncbi:MAG: hypothetical protein K6T67_14650 [Alicyclobacillus sp.]|nr:hypothetical protein [Alicyclobacillus sp.]
MARADDTVFSTETTVGSSRSIGQLPLNRSRISIRPRIHPGDQVFARRCDPKELRLPAARLTWHVDADRGTVTITTDRHARLVTLDSGQPMVLCSDNHFDLPAGEARTISVRTLDGQPVRWDALRVRTLNAAKEGDA